VYVFCMSFKMRKIIYYDLDIVSIYHDSSQSISFVGWLFDIIVLLYTLIGLIARSVYIASNYYISLAVSSLCLIFFHPLNPKTKFRKIFYWLKQFFLLFSFVWIQFYLSLPSGKWVSARTVYVGCFFDFIVLLCTLIGVNCLFCLKYIYLVIIYLWLLV
jgi:hypothetical protein